MQFNSADCGLNWVQKFIDPQMGQGLLNCTGTLASLRWCRVVSMNNQIMESYGHHPGLLELPIYSPAWTPSPSSRNILCWSSAIFSALDWLLLLLRWAAPWWSQLVHLERNQVPSWTYATQDTCWSIGGSLLRTDTPPFHKVLQTLSNSSPDHSLIRT